MIAPELILATPVMIEQPLDSSLTGQETTSGLIARFHDFREGLPLRLINSRRIAAAVIALTGATGLLAVNEIASADNGFEVHQVCPDKTPNNVGFGFYFRNDTSSVSNGDFVDTRNGVVVAEVPYTISPSDVRLYPIRQAQNGDHVVVTQRTPAELKLGEFTFSCAGVTNPTTTTPNKPPVIVDQSGEGYRLYDSGGGVKSFNVADYGSIENQLNFPVVGGANTPSGKGYWEVASDGGIFAFGDAKFFGSTGAIKLNKPMVGMATTPSGNGYWTVASDGGIFAFGDAKFFGSTGGIKLNQPIVGMASTPSGQGYNLVASDGGVFSFGDASFKGSTGNLILNKPVVGMDMTASGNGYWTVASDGGIFAFGDAKFFGSTGGIKLNQPIVGMASTPSGQGYNLVASDGGIFTFGGAKFYGSDPSQDKDAARKVGMDTVSPLNQVQATNLK